MVIYIKDKEQLKEILLAYKSFLGKKCQKLISEGVDVSNLTYGDTEKFTDDFIEECIKTTHLDDTLNRGDK